MILESREYTVSISFFSNRNSSAESFQIQTRSIKVIFLLKQRKQISFPKIETED